MNARVKPAVAAEQTVSREETQAKINRFYAAVAAPLPRPNWTVMDAFEALALELARRYPNVCGDLSLRLPEVAEEHIRPEDMVAHLRRIGTDRILYGSNFPLNEVLHPDKSPAGGEYQLTQTLKGLEALATLPLTEGERADIAGRNFRRWVGLAR